MQTADKHQLKILIDAVRNPNSWLLGGPNESQAIQILKTKFNYSDKKIRALKGA
jgi:hypothetical protein